MSREPRRVTILVDSLLGGGAERVAVEAAAALDGDRYRPHLLVTRHGGPLEELLAEASIPYTVLGRHRGFHPRLLRRAVTLVRASHLLHAHKFEGSMWGALLARLAQRPLVAHEHTFDGRRTARRTLGYRWWIAPSARRIVCVSAPVAESLVTAGVPRGKIAVVPNGVRLGAALTREEARRELGLDAAARVIGMIGRLRPEKRHELALEACSRLRARGVDATLCVVGDGPRAGELRDLAGALGVDGFVVWAGERRDAGRLVRAFDATVLSSSFEGMPLAVLESLVEGVPVVATAVGSLPALLADGGGRTVPPGDAAALTDALEAALGPGAVPTPEQVARARETYGLPSLARALADIYDEALSG